MEVVVQSDSWTRRYRCRRCQSQMKGGAGWEVETRVGKGEVREVEQELRAALVCLVRKRGEIVRWHQHVLRKGQRGHVSQPRAPAF